MRFLFTFFLLFQSLISQQVDPHRLNHNAEPIFQTIHLNLNPDKNDYSGSTIISLKIKEELSSFRLHGSDFNITEIELRQGSELISVGYEFLDYGLLKIKPIQAPLIGDYKLYVTFNGTVSKKGEGISKFVKDSLNYIYTQFQAIKARKSFPCFDEPNFKFPYQISITSPKEYLVVSNTPIETETVNGSEKTVLFKNTKPLPSYLLAFAVGPYETTQIPGLKIPGRIILPKGNLDKSRIAKNMTAKLLTALENYFGMPYPYEKLDFIGVSGHGGAMENPGLVVYMEGLLIDAEEVPLTQKRDIAYFVAHELAHMWFGDLVTLEWWDDTWLNEGFADWISMEILIQQFPELKPREQLLKNFNWALWGDVKATTEPIHRIVQGDDNPEDVFDGLTYAKSQIVLRMIESWIGRDTFKKALNNYFKKYKWKNTTADDLIITLQKVSGKNVKQVMNDFVFQAGIPLLKANLKDANTIQLTQQRYKGVENGNEYNTLWHIPLSIKIYDGNTVHKKKIFLNQHSEEFSFPGIDNIEWVYLKEDLLGYFIAVVPIRFYTNMTGQPYLTKYEKNDLLSGLGYSHLAGILNPTDILDMAYKLRQSSDPSIIETFATRIYTIWNIYKEGFNAEDFSIFANKTVLPLLESVGYGFSLVESNSKTNARDLLFDVLGQNPDVIKRSNKFANKYLKNENTLNSKHRPYLPRLFYSEGTLELHEEIMSRLKNSNIADERWLLSQTIGWFKNDILVKKNLEYSLSADLEPFQRLFIAMGVQSMYKWDIENKQTLIPWLKQNYVTLKEKVSEDILNNWLPFFVWDYDDLSLFNDLFPKDKRSRSMQKSLEKRIETLKKNKKLRELYGKDVKEYLSGFGKSVEATQ